MSQIDQAFIQAYAPDASEAASAEMYGLPPSSPVEANGTMAAPHIQLYPAQENTQVPVPPSSSAEPIPAPHFHGTGNANAHADIATMQQAMFESTVEQSTATSGKQRRPLSAFAEPTPAPSNVFEPVFEVDAFRWPAVTDKLLTNHGGLLTPVVEQLLAASEEGRSVFGIAGAKPEVGCSTVSMCLARLLAVSGKSVALVDSNFAAANMAKNLGLEFDAGWNDVLSGKIPLAECVVRSIDDRMVLLPLCGHTDSPEELLASIQTSVIAGVLRYHYDVVLFDLGAAGRDSQLAVGQQIVEQCRLDASIIVANTNPESTESNQEIDALMGVLGDSCLGVIGNFAAA